MKVQVVWALTVLVAAWCAPGAAQGGSAIRELFQKADANADGRLTLREIQTERPRFPQESFRRLDRDDDGFLRRADFPTRRNPQPRQFENVRLAAIRELMEFDRNDDEQISYVEVTLAKPGYPSRTFQQLDRNGDGFLTAEDGEGPQNVRRGEQSRPLTNLERRARALDRLLQADANGDGKVTFEEAKELYPDLDRRRFGALDRIKDGVLTESDHLRRKER